MLLWTPRSPERPPPSTARSPRSPRTPTPRRPPAVAPLCAGGLGGRGGRPRPLHFFQECAAPHAPPPDAPRGSFLGGLCQGCLCHPRAPWSRLAGSPRSPGSRLPGSALGPFVTLHCPLPAPLGGLAGAAGGATASLSPPPVILPSNGVQAPPLRLSVRGGQGTAGEGHAPSTFSRNARPMPHASKPQRLSAPAS